MKSVLEYCHLVKPKSSPAGSAWPGSQPPIPGRHIPAGHGEPGLSAARRTREAEPSAGFPRPREPGSLGVRGASVARAVRESCRHGARCPEPLRGWSRGSAVPAPTGFADQTPGTVEVGDAA